MNRDIGKIKIKCDNYNVIEYNYENSYINQQECLADQTTDTKEFLTSRKIKIPRTRCENEFVYIRKVRDNRNTFVVIRYNCMGLFVELLTTTTEIDIELKHNDVRIKNHISSILNKVIKNITDIQSKNNYLNLKEFKYIVKRLKESYYSVKQIDTFDNAKIFSLLKSIQNDDENMAYMFIKQ